MLNILFLGILFVLIGLEVEKLCMQPSPARVGFLAFKGAAFMGGLSLLFCINPEEALAVVLVLVAFLLCISLVIMYAVLKHRNRMVPETIQANNN